ncbi:zwei Ig domain protein zig-8-like isoform X2 [Haliotis asinina]|uniref:zwei Ig domain protein zig-8-like isoform X2 n=1 Tax=Haliotis asinina TaxID=109174 RepID=UPI0035324F48
MAELLATVFTIVTQGVLLFFILLLIPDLCVMGATPLEPAFLPTPRNITVMVGQLAKLPCRIENLGSKDVVWRHQGADHFLTIGKLTWVKDPNVISEHRRISFQISDWNLLIKNAQKDRTGIYECQIAATKKYVREVYLIVIDPPAQKPDIFLQGSKYVPVGGEIRLVCNISGRLNAQSIDWFKDGDKITGERYRNYIITRFWTEEDHSLFSELIVDNSQPHDSGMFMCRGSQNEMSSHSVTVRVGGSSNVNKREHSPEREHEQLQTQPHYNSGHLQTEETGSSSSGQAVVSGPRVVSVVIVTVFMLQHWRT